MSESSNIAGLILAAGKSSRMGRPKGLLEFPDGATLLSRQAALLGGAGCSGIVIVIGAEADRVKARHADLRARWIVNGRWRQGQFSSLQAGLGALFDEAHGMNRPAGALVLPVDATPIAPATARAVALAAEGDPLLDAVVPVYGGRGGHPVYISAAFARRLLKIAPSDVMARLDMQMGMAGQVLRIPVDDPNIAANINTAEDWERIS